MPAHLTITARLARDPELKTTGSGKSLCKLTLPVDSGYGDNKSTTWWTATLWGKSAEVAASHLTKGRWVCVSGEAQVRSYDKNDGSQGFSAEVNVNSWSFVGNRQDADEQSSESPPSKGRGRYSMPDVGDGDNIPF